MTVRAAQVLAFPGIDLETLAKLRARACEAFIQNDLSAYQEACMMMRRLIGGDDASETDPRSYECREGDRRRRPLSQETPDRPSMMRLKRRQVTRPPRRHVLRQMPERLGIN
jgi:hypothetical protein